MIDIYLSRFCTMVPRSVFISGWLAELRFELHGSGSTCLLCIAAYRCCVCNIALLELLKPVPCFTS